MRRKRVWVCVAAIAATLAAGSAAAVNCYTVYDRNDNILYRGTLPPIDLSDRGEAERLAMRQRGQHLVAADADRCPGIEYFTGSAGSAALSVDQIVGGTQVRGMSPSGVPMNAATTTSQSAGATSASSTAPKNTSKRTTSSY